MAPLAERIVASFQGSRKLAGTEPSVGQIANVIHRLQQIFTPAELEGMDDKDFMRQVERVWPVARYIDRVDA